MSDFFRKEAIAHQGQKLYGEVIIASHMSFTIIVWLIISIVIVGFSYLLFSEYHRKEVVGGYLRPISGINKVYPVTSGVVDKIFVKEGQEVKKGQLLARIRMTQHLTSGLDLNDSIVHELQVQKKLLTSNLINQESLYKVSKKKLASQIAATEIQIVQATNQLELMRQRLTLNESRLTNLSSLNKSNYISETDLQAQRDSYLTLKQQVSDMQSRLFNNQEQQSQLVLELELLPVQYLETISRIKSSLADVKQKISQADAQRSYDVVSHRDGYVSNVLIKSGMMTQINYPIMSILPLGGILEAVLFVPTRAYGFVKIGQLTRIRYQAFPYQRFGVYDGEIKEVSKSVVLPGEAKFPINFQEPVYQVIVKLDDQSAKAYGGVIPLQSGMLLDADIMVDKRSLFEWLFEPIFSIKGAI